MSAPLGLTPRMVDARNFIERYIAEHGGASPSLADICQALQLKSRTAAKRLVDSLVNRGALVKLGRCARSLAPAAPGGAEIERLPQDLELQLRLFCEANGEARAAVIADAVALHLDELASEARAVLNEVPVS